MKGLFCIPIILIIVYIMQYITSRFFVEQSILYSNLEPSLNYANLFYLILTKHQQKLMIKLFSMTGLEYI